MKNSLKLLVPAALAFFTQFASAHEQVHSADIYGVWHVEAPLVDNNYVYTTGDLSLTEDSISFVATCLYSNGPELTAEVSSPVDYGTSHFNILQNHHTETSSGNANCVADLRAGLIEFRMYGSNRLVIFNRNTGFRMSLVR